MLRILKMALVFELSAVLGLSILMGEFFYHAYETSSREPLPVSFLAALVMLVLGTQQTAMSFHRERLREASILPYGAAPSKLRVRVGYTTFTAMLSLAAAVLLVILRRHLS